MKVALIKYTALIIRISDVFQGSIFSILLKVEGYLNVTTIYNNVKDNGYFNIKESLKKVMNLGHKEAFIMNINRYQNIGIK